LLVNTYLFGIVTYQFALYYRTKFNDRLHVKCMVLILFIIDTVHSVGVIYMGWVYAVTNFNQPSALGYELWPYPFTPIGTAAAALITHLLLGDRIWRLTGNTPLYVCIVILALITFSLGVGCGIWAWIIHVIAELPRIKSIVIAWLSMQVFLDTLITAVLSITLTRAKTGYPPSDTVVRRLIRGAIQTGLFASIFALGDLICFFALPSSFMYAMFATPIGRIYSNTLLDTLLVRKSLRVQLSSSAFERTSRVR
ncbi:hypothetical protein J3A83DRAFT_4112953, partial [Scleroderma citrinum]